MIEDQTIEIPTSKTKMTFSLFCAIALVGAGIFILLKSPRSGKNIFENPLFIYIVGIFSILFFGLCAIVIFRKLFDKKAGLIINEQGIMDNSSGVPAGVILWKDIEEIKVYKTFNQKFIVLKLKNPKEYLDKVKNKFKKKTMNINYKMSGSPINISANSLKISFNDLLTLLNEKLNQYKV